MSTEWALGPLEVMASTAEAEAFRAVTGAPVIDHILPLTFPMRWLAGPAVQDALLGVIAGEELVLVHESQTFDYVERLLAGAPYVLALKIRRTANPDRLVAEGEISTPAGAIHARFETVLRLIPAPASREAITS